MSKEVKWIIGIGLLVLIAIGGGELAILFIGVPVGLAILFGVMIVLERALGLQNDQDNPWKLAVWIVSLLATVCFCFWLGSLTGWWD